MRLHWEHGRWVGKFSGQCETKAGLKVEEALAGYTGEIFPVASRGSETAWVIGAELPAGGGMLKGDKTREKHRPGLGNLCPTCSGSDYRAWRG